MVGDKMKTEGSDANLAAKPTPENGAKQNLVDTLKTRASALSQKTKDESILQKPQAQQPAEIIEPPVDEVRAEDWFRTLANTANLNNYWAERASIKREIDTIEESFEDNELYFRRVRNYLAKVFSYVDREVQIYQREKITLEMELDELDEMKEIKLKDHLGAADSWAKKVWELAQKYIPKIIVPIATSFGALKVSDNFKVIKEAFKSTFGTSGDIVIVGASMILGFIAIDAISEYLKSSRLDKVFKESTAKKKEIIEKENRLLDKDSAYVRGEVIKLKKLYFPEAMAVAAASAAAEKPATPQSTGG